MIEEKCRTGLLRSLTGRNYWYDRGWCVFAHEYLVVLLKGKKEKS